MTSSFDVSNHRVKFQRHRVSGSRDFRGSAHCLPPISFYDLIKNTNSDKESYFTEEKTNSDEESYLTYKNKLIQIKKVILLKKNYFR